MKIQIYNKLNNALVTFVSTKNFSGRSYCGWNDLTPEQELAYGQFVIIDTLGFDTVQTPENNLYQQWNMNGKFLSTTYWGTRLLTVNFVNQGYAKNSFESVANLFYNVLKADDVPLYMTVTDDYDATFYCQVVLNKPNTNQTEDSITFEMLNDVFISMVPRATTYNVGQNKLLNGTINTAPSLQLPMTINNPKNVTGELEFDRDMSNYFVYLTNTVISFVNTKRNNSFQFVNANGTVCTISTSIYIEVGLLVYIDANTKDVYASGVVIESEWIGSIVPGNVRFEYNAQTKLSLCDKKEIGVIKV